jgi:uncharacterized YigZ family protein
MVHSLAAPACSDLIIRKSRFIGCVEPVADRDAALARVAALRAQHPGAAHVCWALLAGGQSAAVDDGEPGGTAGQPMLRVLRHHDLDGVLATVVRYFGGVKLGAGGLVRAYTDAVARALDVAEKVPLRARVAMECEIPYELEGLFRREIEVAGARLEGAAHGAAVRLSLSAFEDDAAALRERLDEAGQGRVRWLAPD